LTLTASDVSDAVLEGLQKLTGYSGVRDALAELEKWEARPDHRNFDLIQRLIHFAISVAETEVARLNDEEENNANQQWEEDHW
jgi:hypothetical protein